ncbi:MAG: type IX secretion system membrane protein PorP/SprF [Adhaeribacter sp.]
MKKYLSLVAFLLVAFGPALAQQRPQYSQYMMNNYLLNPALTGIEDYADVRFGHRQQWVGLEGAPVTYYVSAHMPVGKQATRVRNRGRGIGSTRTVNRNRFSTPYAHHGFGITALTDKTGPLRQSNFTGSYAYHLPLSTKVSISTGVTAGVLTRSFNPQEATFTNPFDPSINSDYINNAYFDLGLGTWLYSETFFVGLSGAQLIKNRRDLNSAEGDGNGGARLQRHFFVTGGYKIRVTPNFDVIPSVMVKLASPSPVSVDVNLKAVYADRVWAGASYRKDDAVSAMGGINISHIMDVGYAYDFNTSNLNIANTGSHEIIIGLKLFNTSKAICPRWMQ